MEPLLLASLDGVREIAKQSFVSVFAGINREVETLFQLYKIRATSRDKYADYIARSVGVFPLFATTKRAYVESAYVSVGISSAIERERYRSAGQIAESLHQQRRGKGGEPKPNTSTLYVALNNTNDAIALVGNPGSGKTTALRHLAVTLAKGAPIRGRKVIPVFLAVRDLALMNQGVEEAMIALFASLDIGEPKAVAHALLESGDIAILLDGIDEADRAFQSRLLAELKIVRDVYKSAVLCVSGRPYTLNIGMAGFEKWETLPLSMDERIALVRKWYDAVDPNKGARLLSECSDNPGLLDLGSNPLLLAIVCALYYNDLKIPSQPDELYARTVEGLLGAWDAFRDVARHTPLHDYTVRRRVVLVSWIAATMFDMGRVVFSVRDIETSNVLRRYTEATHADVLITDDVLRSLYNDFGILIERAPRLFSFSHLTLQEYLTAQYIVDNRRELELLKHYRHKEWREVLRLVAKMLPNADEYMGKLTELLDLANDYDVALLRDAWLVHPICGRTQALLSVNRIASRVRIALDTLRASYRIANTELIVTLHDDYRKQAITMEYDSASPSKRRRGIAKRIAMLKNLPIILATFREMGVSAEDIPIRNTPPFNMLREEARIQRVVVENW